MDLDYYKNYFANGGVYKLEDYVGSSRVLMITRWLRANLKPGDKVLDIGCGDGTYSRLMPEFEWTGIDINEEKTAYAGTRLTGDLFSGMGGLHSGGFAACVCSEVLEHLWAPEEVHAEAHRLLQARGVYVISTPNFDWVEHPYKNYQQVVYDPAEVHTKEHIRFFTLAAHTKMLDKAGFTVADFMGADMQFGSYFAQARRYLHQEVLKQTNLGEVDYILGRCFPTVAHTIGILGVKR